MTEPEVATVLADLRGLTLEELRAPEASCHLAPYREALVGQVERPRPNIGSGPPGRAD